MADSKLQLWTLSPLGKGGTIAAHRADLIRFSADGKRLVVSEVDDKAKCYSVSDAGQLSLNQEYEATYGVLWISDDGKFGACFSYSDTSRLMRIFRCDTKAEKSVPVVTKSLGRGMWDPDVYPEDYLLSNDATRALVKWPEGRIEVFNVRSALSDWGCRVPELAHVWLVARGDKLLTIDESGVLQVHDTTAGRVRRHIVNVESKSQARRRSRDTKFRFQVLPDGKHCVVWCGASLREFVVIEMATQKVVGRAKYSEDGSNVRAWRVSDDGSIVCVVKDRVELLRTGFQSREIKSIENTGRFHLALKASGIREPVHGIYDTKSGQLQRTVQWEYVKDDSFRNWAHISGDGQWCALVGRRLQGGGMGVEVRSTKSGKQEYAIPLGDADFQLVDFCRDQTGMWVLTRESLLRLDFQDKTLAPFLTASETHTKPVKYDPQRPTPLPDSTWHTSQFESFAESDTGWIATGHRRGFVNIWSIKDGKRYAFLRCGTEIVKALAFSRDGKFLLSWCADRNSLQVTDVSSILPASAPDPLPANKSDVNLDF